MGSVHLPELLNPQAEAVGEVKGPHSIEHKHNDPNIRQAQPECNCPQGPRLHMPVMGGVQSDFSLCRNDTSLAARSSLSYTSRALAQSAS